MRVIKDFPAQNRKSGLGRILADKRLIGLLLLACGVLGACGREADVSPVSPSPFVLPATTAPTPLPPVATAVPLESALARPYAYTYQQPDGNRLVPGSGTLPPLTPLDIPLEGAPAWVTAVPLARGALWGVVLDDGRTQAFLVDGGNVTPIDSNDLTPNIAPVMTVDPQQGVAIFLHPPAADPAGSNPVIYNAQGHMALSDPAGHLRLEIGEQPAPNLPPLTLLPDARILFDENGRLLFLTDPTNRYGHGVLGDALEAGSITLLETSPELGLLTQIFIPAPQVVEGIQPLWLDWNGDGRREIIVTVSDAAQGARIQLYNEAGQRLAQGPAIGQGGRWRHQIAVAPFGPAEEMELAAVLTPHIGGVVEFYRWQGDRLDVVAQLPGYTSHVIGTNNLDMALAGDFNGDGRVELLLPTQDRTRLGGVQRTADGAAAVYEVSVGGEVVTNLAGVTLASGETAVGVGRDDNTLRIWQP